MTRSQAIASAKRDIKKIPIPESGNDISIPKLYYSGPGYWIVTFRPVDGKWEFLKIE